jgi:hypothetical protein
MMKRKTLRLNSVYHDLCRTQYAVGVFFASQIEAGPPTMEKRRAGVSMTVEIETALEKSKNSLSQGG